MPSRSSQQIGVTGELHDHAVRDIQAAGLPRVLHAADDLARAAFAEQVVIETRIQREHQPAYDLLSDLPDEKRTSFRDFVSSRLHTEGLPATVVQLAELSVFE